MEHKQIVYGDYVFTPCQNAFNKKVSYWISKRDYTFAVYAFTPMGKRDLKDHLSEDGIKAYIRLFDTYEKGLILK